MAVARGLYLMAGTALLVASCATYTPRPLVPQESASALEARTLDDPRLRQFISNANPAAAEAATGSWDLTALTLAALYYHPDIEVARAKLVTSRAAVITAGQRPNPSLSITPTKHTTILDPSAWTVGIVVDVLLETFGRRGYRIAWAEGLAEAARDDLATASWQVRGGVRSALLALWAAETRLELTERRRALQEQLVGLLERRLVQGAASALDVTRERINFDQISLAVEDANRQAAEARVSLAMAIGVPARALDGVNLSLKGFDAPASPPDDVADLRREALLGRTDVRALLAEYEASQSALQLEVARQYPNIALGPGYTYDQGDNQYTLGLSTELPIFNQNQGPIAEAEARRREAGARFTALQARIIGEIDRATALYHAATRTLATADGLRSAEDRHSQQVERSFRAGEADRPTLLGAQIELAAIELSRFDAVVQQRQALGLLEDGLKHPLFDPTAALFMPKSGPHRQTEPTL